jgi:hypothetical protein
VKTGYGECLRPFGEDCDLRRHGEKIAQRGGKKAKKRAAVAVARKLAVLLHRLWLTSEVYDPFHVAKLAAESKKRSGARATPPSSHPSQNKGNYSPWPT